MRGGTENVPYIIGLGEAAKLIEKNMRYNEYLDNIKSI